MEKYPDKKLSGQIGAEFVGVIDDIANRYRLIKQYDDTHAAYQKALEILLKNTSYDADIIKKINASIYHQLGVVAQEQRQWEQAREYYLKALEILIEYDDEHSLSVVIGNLSLLYSTSQDAGLPAAVAGVLGISAEEAENLLSKSEFSDR